MDCLVNDALFPERKLDSSEVNLSCRTLQGVSGGECCSLLGGGRCRESLVVDVAIFVLGYCSLSGGGYCRESQVVDVGLSLDVYCKNSLVIICVCMCS